MAIPPCSTIVLHYEGDIKQSRKGNAASLTDGAHDLPAFYSICSVGFAESS